jgi:hypothetical protein
MENVWEYLRGNKLSARVWDSYEAIVEACADAWNFFVNDPDRIRSIGTRDWATVNLRAGGNLAFCRPSWQRSRPRQRPELGSRVAYGERGKLA